MKQVKVNQRIKQVLARRNELFREIQLEVEDIKKMDPSIDVKSFISHPRTSALSFVSDPNEYLRQRQENADLSFFERMKPLLDNIPESNGSRFFEKKDIKIGVIADEFLFQSYKGISEFIYITKENFKQYRGALDIFFVASAWRGLENEWKGLANPRSEKLREELYQIIEEYKKSGTKIVFYSKEDPVNYDRFIDIARKCEYVFTTAVEKIKDYKRDCNTENVFLLEFGINPLYHNPIGIKKYEKQKEVLFAGSWYSKYSERQKETQMIFDGVLEAGTDLKILDRNYELNHQDYFFPEAYIPYLSPAVKHEYLQKLHKLYNWSINLNSIKFSDTMFANRVYELQAIGNLLLSNYSLGVNNKFPNVFIINNKDEVGSILNGFSEEELFQHQVLGIRRVMSNETTFHRLDHLLSCIGMNKGQKVRRVAVLTEEITEQVKENFGRQSYEHKELILIKDFNDSQKANFDMVAFFHPDRIYEEYYLEDMINGFKYTNSEYITKDSYYEGSTLIEGKQFDYVSEMKDKYRTVFWADNFSAEALINMDGTVKINNGFSIDPFEHNNSVFKKNVQSEEIGDPVLSVIVPTYNNGEHLLNKCFNSLRRSSIFHRMEIIMVDDGSTDEFTPQVIERIERKYPNVKSFLYKDGGSGSASRPRNKGFELSKAPYITYLDPDNEAVQDGYAVLLDVILNSQYDMVVGNIVKIDNERSVTFDYYKTSLEYNGSDVIDNPKKYLMDAGLRAQSIQALVVKRHIIADNNLQMILNAGGQDTLFFQELLLNSKKTKIINLNIHIYYAAVTGSVTNTISRKFFDKFYELEKHRLPFLVREGLLESYMEKRFTFYFTNWYLKRLPKVLPEDVPHSIDTLQKVYQLYEDHVTDRNKIIMKFAKYSRNKQYDKVMKLVNQVFQG
ncbi:glycosyltransferase [Cytobacillus firmus]|uniref:glycosyltransferase n=1 Tax=Cytobacillus firmus TaxID=1399 RepID=UPI00384AF4E6